MICDYTQNVWITTNKGVFSVPYTEIDNLFEGKTDNLNVNVWFTLVDGKGYSDGLRGQNIPWVARIIAVADTFDAMSSARP